MTHTYEFWTAALADPKEVGKGLPVHEGDAQPGFYRKRNGKDGPWLPVAIWEQDGQLVAKIGDKMGDPVDLWSWVCRFPVSEAAYRKAVDGNGWDDDAPVAPIGHNLPDDPHEALKLEFQAEKELADTFLKTPITTQEQADKAAVWSKKLAGIAKKATDLHKVEKQPSLDAGRAVDDKWRDLKEEPADLSKKLKRHMDAFLIEQQRLENERRRKEQEEADRLRREAEERARAAEQGNDETALAEAEQLKAEASEREKAAQATNAHAGRTGAKVSLRTFVSARIVDYDKALVALKDHPEMKALVEQLANRAVRAGVEVAGVERFEEKRAA
ncbi:hypothetical protein [Brucella anthropi]|uniref:hypothetical protein n=1 Tax=Brucella anthropi TaxID=529 RepID=UPI0021585769|nr:hypothetical protein [Brucella anthropi]MCR8492793.1 hypothetical protein [Brucella anthropi]